jgi:hypothetical protein
MEEMREKVKMERDAWMISTRQDWLRMRAIGRRGASHMKRVMQKKGGNPYYRWIAGSD